MDVEEPIGWREKKAQVLQEIARANLPSSDATLSSEDLLLLRAPWHDGFGCLDTEGDVVCAVLTYMVNPVNIALRRCFPTSAVLMSCEATTKSSRTDIRWSLRQSEHEDARNTVPIAVMELKAKGVLHFEDFENAMATNDQEERDLRQRSERSRGQSNSLFKENAIWIMKQTSKYVAELGISDIVVFDWSRMFILDYAPSNDSNDSNDPEEIVRGTWIDENSVSRRDYERFYTFRAFLFAFLLRAIARHIPSIRSSISV